MPTTGATEAAYELTSWSMSIGVTDNGEPVIAIIPKLRPPGGSKSVQEPPMFLRLPQAQGLVDQLAQQLARLRAMTANPEGRH